MEKKEELIEIVKQLIFRSEEKLESAKILLENEKFDDAISRAYYAAFLAARAILYLLGSSPRTHRGVITMFGLKVIKEGLLSVNVGRYLNELFEAGETSDYAIIVFYTRKDSEQYIKKAEEIVNAIKKLIKTKFKIKL